MINWTDKTKPLANILFVCEGANSLEAIGVNDSFSKLFEAKQGSIFQTVKDDKVFVVAGLGDIKALDSHDVKNICAKAARAVSAMNITDFAVDTSPLTSEFKEQAFYDIVLGVELGLYGYAGIHKTNESKTYTAAIIDKNFTSEQCENFITKAKNLAQGMMLARDWVNSPGNYLTPDIFAKDMQEKLKSVDCEVTIFDEKQIKSLEMNTFLAVGDSSDNPSRFVVMKYKGNPKSDITYAYVGKGITVDTGGYCLKSAQGLMYTKGDMGGAAAVAGAIYAIAKNKLKVNVTAIVPTCENRLSNKSYIPGDVVQSMNGKTIEILNTDAEGRLILADALTYAVRNEKASYIVDVATLTGAVVNAFGTVAAGCMTNKQDYLDNFLSAADTAGEKYWQLPTFKEYEEMLKSKVADLKNAGGPTCGSIAAGLFLREFVEDTPWVHLDIAGTSQTESPKYDYHCFGGTGAAVPSLYFLADQNQNK